MRAFNATWSMVDLGGEARLSTPDRLASGQLARARTGRLPGVLLVDNWSQAVNDFSERLTHRPTQPDRRRRRRLETAGKAASADGELGWAIRV